MISIMNPVSLSMPVMKELGAKWLVQMAEYISENPNIVSNGFIKAGALDEDLTDLDSDDDLDTFTDEDTE